MNFHQDKFRPPHYLLALLIVATALQLWLKPPKLIEATLPAVVLFFGGYFISKSAMMRFVRRETPVRHNEKPTALVTDGPFRYTRNPMYVGVEILLIGLALQAGSWPYLTLPAVMFFILNFIFIPWEERRMEELFKEEYLRYKQKVRRWI